MMLQVLLGMDIQKIELETSQYVLRHLRRTQHLHHVLKEETIQHGRIQQ